MKIKNTLFRILDGLILLVFILFFSSAGFQDRNTSGWYQQWFPNLNGSTIKDITFLDSLTGFAVTTTDPSLRSFILKTTNGGDNWDFVHTYIAPSTSVSLYRIQFANKNTGYACTNYHEFFKTTNAGENWINISEPPWALTDMHVLNTDTVFGVSYSAFSGGVYRSTNGGYNWQTIWSIGGSGNPQKIYMVNKDLGFTQNEGLSNYMKRTTNGGFNWDEISGEKFKDIVFFDNNTGWKVNNEIRKTTNGGINWFLQQTPNIINGFYSPAKFSVLNKDTVWMVGAYKYGGYVLKTTNGGLNWGYQCPNPTLPIYWFYIIQFVDSKHGWINIGNILLHTKIGGNDTTFFTGINNNIRPVLSDYQLYQNFPNPFNPRTVISFQLFLHGGRTERAVVSNLSIKVYDINGREVQTLVSGRMQAGTYEAVWDGTGFPSGVYFCRMVTEGYGKTIKMTLVK